MASAAKVHPIIADEVVSLAIERIKNKTARRDAMSRVNVPKTDDELWDYVKRTWGYEIPRAIHPDCVVKGHVAPFTAFADSYFARVPNSLWIGSRGFSGKTMLSSLLCITEETTLGADVTLLGGSLEQSGRGHEYTVAFWSLETAPIHLLRSDPTKRETILSNGGRERVQAASSKSVRGAHPQRLRIDEVDEMDIRVFDAAQGQPMAKDGLPSQVTITSTHHYAHGPVTILKRRIAEGEFDCVIYEWCYRESLTSASGGHETGWLTNSMVAEAKARMSKQMFLVEVELQEPSVEGRAISSQYVDIAFNRDYGVFKGGHSELIEVACCRFMKPENGPCQHHGYATGVDWGQRRDWSVYVTYRTDVNPWWLVSWERSKDLPWPALLEKFERRMARYPGEAAHDATGMGGRMADDFLRIDAVAVTLQGNPRNKIFTDYIIGIESQEISGPFIESLWYDHYYVTNDDLYGAGHPPDSFIAGALAWSIRTGFAGGKVVGIGSLSKIGTLHAFEQLP